MIVTLKMNTPQMEIDKLMNKLGELGVTVQLVQGNELNVFALLGDTSKVDIQRLKAFEWVKEVTRIAAPYKMANRNFHAEDSVIDVSGIKIGGNNPIVIIGGPCSIEGKDETLSIAEKVKDAGGVMLRGGAYKPRTSPYAFQGLGYDGIMHMVDARNKTGMPIVSELMSADKIDEFIDNVDIIQIGARNMQNFDLLKTVGSRTTKPILLKRGISATIEEWIMSAEYVMASGNPNVIFCERGFRTFEPYTRNTLDLSVIPIIKEKTHLPIIIDPSHATGDWKLVESASLAAIAAGTDGLIIEVHENPDCAWSDGAQSLKPEKFKTLIEKAKRVANAVDREILTV